jgi:hypothetical protein
MWAWGRIATTTFIVAASGFLVVACGSGSPSGPTKGDGWHGALVEGARLEEAVHVLDAAWPRVTQRFPNRDLAHWRIVWTESLIDLAEYPTVICGTALCDRGSNAVGLTLRQSRVIVLSWAMPPSRHVAVAEWELCNALRGTADLGCS